MGISKPIKFLQCLGREVTQQVIESRQERGLLEIQTRKMALTEVHAWFLCKSQSVTRNEAIRNHDLFFVVLTDQLLK